MAEKVKKPLTAKQVAALETEGEHWVADNLRLQIKPNGARSWILRYMLNGRLRRMGLGPYPLISLADAKVQATEMRLKVYRGIDPVAERQAAKPKVESITFKEAATRCIDARAKGWRDEAGSRKKWEQSLRDYVIPKIGKKLVSEIQVADVFKVLEPIWQSKTSTADKVRNRIETILSWSIAHGFRPAGTNPAQWRGGALRDMLPSPQRIHKVEHHDAVDFNEMPAFMKLLRAQDGQRARALELVALTGVRSADVINAPWSEFDLNERVWVLPENRQLKSGRVHRVPLSDEAMSLLGQQPKGKGYVFTGSSPHKHLPKNCLQTLMRRLHDKATVHGLRSSLRDWAAEATSYSREVIEMSLAHKVGTSTERAYWRSDMLDQRRALLQDWAVYLSSGD